MLTKFVLLKKDSPRPCLIPLAFIYFLFLLFLLLLFPTDFPSLVRLLFIVAHYSRLFMTLMSYFLSLCISLNSPNGWFILMP